MIWIFLLLVSVAAAASPQQGSSEWITKWARRAQVSLEDIQVRDLDDGLGVFAAKDVAEGTVLLSVPLERSLPSGEGSTLEKDCGTGLRSQAAQATSDGVLALLLERERGKKSPFFEYIMSLPKFTQFASRLPWLVSEEVWKDFSAIDIAGDYGSAVRYQAEEMEPIIFKFSENLGMRKCFKNAPTIRELKWAQAVVLMRGYAPENTLVPIADIIRKVQDETVNAQQGWNEHKGGSKFLEVKATRDIAEGEEIKSGYQKELLQAHEAAVFGFGILPEGGNLEPYPDNVCRSLLPKISKYVSEDDECVHEHAPCTLARLARWKCSKHQRSEL